MRVLGIEHCVRATGTPNHGANSPGSLKEWVCMCFCECGNVCAHAYVVYMCIYLCVCECIHWYACEHVGPLAHLYLWRPETDIFCLPLLLSILSLVFDDFLHKAGAYWFSFAGRPLAVSSKYLIVCLVIRIGNTVVHHCSWLYTRNLNSCLHICTIFPVPGMDFERGKKLDRKV